MPSSPEAHRWEPADLQNSPPPAGSRVRPHRLFEVHRPRGVPEELIAPARAAAESAGYAAGWAKGVEAARAVVDAEQQAARRATEARADQLMQALVAAESAARRLEQRSVPALAEIEDVLITAAFDLAEAIVGARLRDDQKRGLDALRRVLALAPGGEPVRVHLHPADLDVVRGADVPPGVELVPDPAQTPGDAVARCGATEIDGRIRTAVARVREQLLDGSTGAAQ
jgi:flagellar assembly protein FliH